MQRDSPVVLADSSNSRGASWGDDGTIVAKWSTRPASRVFQPKVERSAGHDVKPRRSHPSLAQGLPGSQTILFTANKNISAFDDASIEVLSLKNNQRKTLRYGGYFGRYLPFHDSRGTLVFIHQGTLFGVAFDLNRLETQESPLPILDDVASDPTTAGGQLDVGKLAGALVCRSGRAAPLTISRPILLRIRETTRFTDTQRSSALTRVAAKRVLTW